MYGYRNKSHILSRTEYFCAPFSDIIFFLSLAIAFWHMVNQDLQLLIENSVWDFNLVGVV